MGLVEDNEIKNLKTTPTVGEVDYSENTSKPCKNINNGTITNLRMYFFKDDEPLPKPNMNLLEHFDPNNHEYDIEAPPGANYVSLQAISSDCNNLIDFNAHRDPEPHTA